MKKKPIWVGAALLALGVVALIATWPRYLPIERMHGEPEGFSSFEEMVHRAELIVLADVKAVKQGPDYVSPIIGTSATEHYPTQRVTLEAAKVYKGDAVPGQTLTLYQEGVGVTRSIQFPWPVFRINENDPVYERGERYVLMLWPVPVGEEIKPYQPEPWQEGLFGVVHPAGRMRLNADGTVTSVLDSFGTNGKTSGEIEARIAAAVAAPPYPATYNGVPLPMPRPVVGFDGLPPVWLIVGDQAIPPSLAAGGTSREHGDPAYAIPNLPTASLPADARAVIVVGSESVKSFKATVRPWSEDGRIVPLDDETARELKAEVQREGNLTVFILEPTGDAGDQLLNVNITFPVDDSWGFYLWRLNPAPDATPMTTSSRSHLAQAREALSETDMPPRSQAPLLGHQGG